MLVVQHNVCFWQSTDQNHSCLAHKIVEVIVKKETFLYFDFLGSIVTGLCPNLHIDTILEQHIDILITGIEYRIQHFHVLVVMKNAKNLPKITVVIVKLHNFPIKKSYHSRTWHNVHFALLPDILYVSIPT